MILPQTIPLSHSCPIIIIIIIAIIITLCLGSTNEQIHVIFGFLSLAYLTQQADL
jgi:uncharacterized membrane protein YciS (DUF1049 family)